MVRNNTIEIKVYVNGILVNAPFHHIHDGDRVRDTNDKIYNYIVDCTGKIKMKNMFRKSVRRSCD